MRFVRLLTLASICLSMGLAEDLTIPLANLKTVPDLNGIATAVRTVLDIREVQTDEARFMMTMSGTDEKLAAAQWLVHQLDQSAGGPAVGPDYKIACADRLPDCVAAGGEVIRVLRLNPAASSATHTALVTSIRTVADIRRMMPVEGSKSVAVRGTLAEVNAAEWIFRELTPPDGRLLTGDSLAYPRGKQAFVNEEQSMRVFRLAPAISVSKLIAIVTTIRVICDVQRLMPMEEGRAILAGAPADKLVVAEWLVHQLNASSHPASVVETTMKLGPTQVELKDYMVRIFYIHSTDAELNALATEMRNHGLSRTMSLPDLGAIAVRGRVDQMALAQTILDKAR